MENLSTIFGSTQLTSLPGLTNRTDHDTEQFSKIVTYKNICNNLSSLPKLPSTLISLNVNNNNLEQLPALPSTLLFLYCSENKLKTLPELPAKLHSLACYKNNLTFLPKFPSSLKELFCGTNQLTIIPDLSTSVTHFWYDPNPFIYKLNHMSLLQEKKEVNDTNAKIRRFVDLFYIWKYRDKFRKWLWERIRKPRILRDLLLVDELLATGIDPIDIIDHLPVYHY